MKYLILILLFTSCGTLNQKPKYKDTTIYRYHYKDTTVMNYYYQDSTIYIPLYIPRELRDQIKSGEIKYTIDYK